MPYTNQSVQRSQIADYLDTGASPTPVWSLMGVGFESLDENPNAQTEKKTYICDKSATSVIKSYETQFPFTSDLIKSESAIMKLHDIGRNQLTGGDAECDYIRVELFNAVEGSANTYQARKFHVCVEVSGLAGAGGENIKVSGNLNNVGSFVDGTFNTSTKTFTASAE